MSLASVTSIIPFFPIRVVTALLEGSLLAGKLCWGAAASSEVRAFLLSCLPCVHEEQVTSASGENTVLMDY